jgi:four helix bundle protein
MQDYRKLVVWERARSLTRDVFFVTAQFPDVDRFGLAAQLRKSANSMGANIAEGAGRPTQRDFARFRSIALASVNETEHHLTIAGDVGLLPDGRALSLVGQCDEIRLMLLTPRSRIRG